MEQHTNKLRYETTPIVLKKQGAMAFFFFGQVPGVFIKSEKPALQLTLNVCAVGFGINHCTVKIVET